MLLDYFPNLHMQNINRWKNKRTSDSECVEERRVLEWKKIFLEDCPTSSDISEENNDIVFTNIIFKGGYFTKQRSIGKKKKEINK